VGVFVDDPVATSAVNVIGQVQAVIVKAEVNPHLFGKPSVAALWGMLLQC